MFALAGTGGMAKRIYDDVISRWLDLPFRGVTQKQYESLLRRTIGDEKDTDALAAAVVELIWAERVAARSPRDLIFISYAHKDRPWIPKVRAALEPLFEDPGSGRPGRRAHRPGRDLARRDPDRARAHEGGHPARQRELPRLRLHQAPGAAAVPRGCEEPRGAHRLDPARRRPHGRHRARALPGRAPPERAPGPLGERPGEAAVAAALVEVRSKLERSSEWRRRSGSEELTPGRGQSRRLPDPWRSPPSPGREGWPPAWTRGAARSCLLAGRDSRRPTRPATRPGRW